MDGILNAAPTLSGSISQPATLSGSLSQPSTLSGVLTVPRGGGGSYVLPPATTGTLGGVIVGDDLLVTPEGRLSVDKATTVEEDNTRPITAAAVYAEVGNINALLATI